MGDVCAVRASLIARGNMSNHVQREAWMADVTDRLRAEFQRAGYPLPAKVHVSCGFPGWGSKFKRVGECWSPEASADGYTEIFVSPVLADLQAVFGTLLHELCHAATPGAKHGPTFKKCGAVMGLVGKPKSMGSDAATMSRYMAILDAAGPYPHASMNLVERKKQSTRLLKCECASCGYLARVTSKWIEQSGAPVCPTCAQPMEVAA